MYKESLNGKKLRNAAKYMPLLLLIAVMIGGNDQIMEGQTRNLREAIRVYQLLQSTPALGVEAETVVIE